VESLVSALLLFVLLCLVIVQIVSRYVLQTPFSWTEELARYAMVWLVFIAAAQITSQDGHIAITFIDRFASGVALKCSVILSRLIVFITCVVLMPGGWRLVNAMMNVAAPASNIPLGFIYLAGLLGLFLVGLHSIASAVLIALDRIPATAPPELMETGGIVEEAK
jgi:TRAP-type C4-dicarboxylate transport system permease small subunit